MPQYRRNYVPGGTYFFTLVTHHRRRFLTDALARTCLRHALQTIQEKWPFEIIAIVLLPDHLHCLWSLPPGDTKYSLRWRRIKEEFTTHYLEGGGKEGKTTLSRVLRGERAIWQRRFWEHTIDDEIDFERHFDYLHYNPVKHGYVQEVKDWPYSSFHRWVKEGIYPENWGSGVPMTFDDLDESAME